MWFLQHIRRLSGRRRPSSSTEGPARRARPRRTSRYVAPPSGTLVEGVFVVVVVPVVVNRRSLVPRLRGVQPEEAADGARRRARRAHARRRHRVVVVRARRWLLPYARGRSVLCCYYATRLFMVWARYQCVGGPQSWRNNGPRCCPKRLEGLSRCPRPANNRSTQNASAARPRPARREAKSAHGSRDLSSKLRVERVERTSGSGDGRGRPQGSVATPRVSLQGLIKMSTTASR